MFLEEKYPDKYYDSMIYKFYILKIDLDYISSLSDKEKVSDIERELSITVDNWFKEEFDYLYSKAEEVLV